MGSTDNAELDDKSEEGRDYFGLDDLKSLPKDSHEQQIGKKVT